MIKLLSSSSSSLSWNLLDDDTHSACEVATVLNVVLPSKVLKNGTWARGGLFVFSHAASYDAPRIPRTCFSLRYAGL